MSFASLNPPLTPRRGTVLKVVTVARISTEHQDAKSLEDQAALYRAWLKEHYTGDCEITVIASRGSGERLDSAELAALADHIASGRIDLVLTEDLGRITRRVHAIVVCEDCQDAGVRLIAINDNVDTACEGWRMSSMFASLRHESYNVDTGKRIRRTQRNRFMQGGQLRTPLFCYHKPPGAKSDLELTKIPEMVPIVEEIFRRLEAGHSFNSIADYMNEHKVPCGRGAKTKTWKGAHVRNVLFNPMLKGIRVHNRKTLIRINKTGRRKAIPAPPEDLLERAVPHLAFIEPERYDRLIRRIKEQNAIFDVRRSRGYDPRAGRPIQKTRFPGQQVICGICNRTMVFGGNGLSNHLMCSGARNYTCWNASTFDADLACRNISRAIFDFIRDLPDFDPVLRQMIVEESEQLTSGRDVKRQSLQQDAARTEREIENVLKVIRDGGAVPLLQEELARLASERQRLAAEIADLAQAPKFSLELPPIEELKSQARQAIEELAFNSYEFAMLMRRMIPKIVAYPVRLCDGGEIEIRARFRLSLAGYLPAGCRVPSIESHLSREIVVDLFEPVQRSRFREEIVALRASGMTERQVANQLGLTVTATQRAYQLHRLMQRLGLTDPYVPVVEPPSDLTRMRRHLHRRYRFDPLPRDEAI